MRTLYLLRHAKSSWHDETLSDFDRPLKKRGRDAAKLVGELVRKEKLSDILVVSSPAQRTRETIRIVLKNAKLDPEVRFDPQIYEAELSGLLEVLERIQSDHECVMIVGHNPVTYLTNASRGLMHGRAALGDVTGVLIASAVITAVASPIAMWLYRKER